MFTYSQAPWRNCLELWVVGLVGKEGKNKKDIWRRPEAKHPVKFRLLLLAKVSINVYNGREQVSIIKFCRRDITTFDTIGTGV